MAQAVGRHVVGEPGLFGVAGEHRADAAGAVRLLPAGLEEKRRVFGVLAVDVQREGFLEACGERDGSIFAAFALGHADPARVEVDVGEADRDEL